MLDRVKDDWIYLYHITANLEQKRTASQSPNEMALYKWHVCVMKPYDVFFVRIATCYANTFIVTCSTDSFQGNVKLEYV